MIMAHDIEINNGVASYAENGKKERAWHYLGQVFDRPMTVKEALEASHADYSVELQPVVALTPAIKEAMANGTVDSDLLLEAMMSGRKATMRMDKSKPLGIVSDQYGIVQNIDAFKFIDTLCTGQTDSREDTPIIECAGVLGHGERVFITAKFPESIILDNKTDDRVEMYMVFTTSHDGTSAVKCMVTPTRVVCNNTLNFALRHNAGSLSLRHSANIMDRLDLTNKENDDFTYKTLNLYHIYKKSLEQNFERLRNIKITDKWLEDILAQVALADTSYDIYKKTGNVHHKDIPAKGRNIYDNMLQAVETGIGQEYGERGTGMWLMNGITTYYQNECNFRSEETKFDSIQAGTAKMKVQRAFELVTA